MADKNQNRGNQSWQSDQDWDRNKRRSSQQSDYNQNRERSGYGYNQGSSQSRRNYRGTENQGDYNRLSDQDDYSRVNYMPDNDENRYETDRDYENTGYGTSGTYGYRGSSQGYNQGRYSSGMGSSYGSSGYSSGMGQGSDYGRQSWQRENQGMGSYGSSGYGSSGYGSSGYGSSGYGSSGYGSSGYGSGYGSMDYGEDYGNMSREGRSRGERGRYDRERGRQQQDRGWWDRTRDEVSSWFGDEDAERRRDMDRYSEGGYKGKGPKNYHRSEERIKEDICDRFTDDDMLDATDIDIEVNSDEVVLTGSVNNRMQKRRAEDLAESVSGVRNVENRLRVGQSSNITLTDSTSGTSSMLTNESK